MLRNLRNRSAEPNSSTSDGAPDAASDDAKSPGLPVVSEPAGSNSADSSIRGRLNRVTRYATHSKDGDDKDSQEQDAEAVSDDAQDQDPVQQEAEQLDQDSEQEAMALTDEVVEDIPEEAVDETVAADPEPIQQAGPIDDDVAPEDQILTVGRGIRLAAEVCECDTLIVEGQFEAKAKARKLQIPARGAFKGEAEVAEAEISGAFDGALTVSGRLTIHSDAVVFGSIQYGEVVIEAGGQIGGEVACLTPRQSAVGVKAA